jgi:hypothetical protein
MAIVPIVPNQRPGGQLPGHGGLHRIRRILAPGYIRKTRYIGLGANQVAAHVLASAYNLLRIAKLMAAAT